MLKLLFFTSRYLKETPVQIENGFYTLRCIDWWNIIYKEDKPEFVGDIYMSEFTINEMKEMQKMLQEKYKDKWEGISAEVGQNKLLWMVGEIC